MKIKILFWKLIQAYNECMIKWSESDLEMFERRSLVVEKHLRKLGVHYNDDLDDSKEDDIVIFDEIAFGSKGVSKDV